jgi:hypothetical protein
LYRRIPLEFYDIVKTLGRFSGRGLSIVPLSHPSFSSITLLNL